MTQQPARRQRWGHPRAWEHHLCVTWPSAPVGQAPAERSQMRAHAQIHSMRRDEQGRFNELAGGIPEWTEGFARDLQRGVDAMFAAGRVQNLTPPPAPSPVTLICPYAIEAAIEQVKADMPYHHSVLRYFQTPPGLRRFDAEGFACQLMPPVELRGLYRLKKQACYAVWERLPLVERLKAGV